MNSEKLIEMLRKCATEEGACKKCELDSNPYCTEYLMKQAADVIEELLKVAKAMHTWIFLNSADEQAVYDECGLSDEMNVILGYGGQFVGRLPKEES